MRRTFNGPPSRLESSQVLWWLCNERRGVDRLQYVALMIACLVLTLPLEFAFGARVWRRPKRLVRSVLPVALFFLAWDMWATNRGDWGFNPRYTIGWTLPGGVVVEEILFFVTIPVCTLLTLEAVRNMLAGTTPLQQWVRAR